MTTPYYEDEWVTLYCEDAQEVAPLIQADVLVTDPPYGLGMEYNADRPFGDNAFLVKAAASVVAELLDRIPVGLVTPGLANVWAYPKPVALGCWYIPGNPGRGFPWSHPEWEPILVYTNRLLGGSSVFRASIDNQRGVGDHPCPKPLLLMRQLVNLVTKNQPDAVVFDPFAGSGTTLRAAKDLGRKSIGIEIEQKFCDLIVERLAQEVLAVS